MTTARCKLDKLVTESMPVATMRAVRGTGVNSASFSYSGVITALASLKSMFTMKVSKFSMKKSEASD